MDSLSESIRCNQTNTGGGQVPFFKPEYLLGALQVIWRILPYFLSIKVGDKFTSTFSFHTFFDLSSETNSCIQD